MSSEYQTIFLHKGSKVYIRKESLDALKVVDAILFDCDGVLIDSSSSYDVAIQSTVKYIIQKLTSVEVPQNIASKKIIKTFRKSGGYNCDWDTSYVIIVAVFNMLPKGFRKDFLDKHSSVISDPELSPINKILKMSSIIRKKLPNDYFFTKKKHISKKLMNIASLSDENGVSSSMQTLLNDLNNSFDKKFHKTFQKFLAHNNVKSRIVARIFNELFYGEKLFKKINGLESEIPIIKGLIEKDKLIVKENTFQKLRNRFGENKLGLVTGRGSIGVYYTLGKFYKYFNQKAMIFIEDLMQTINEKNKAFSKPEPHALLKASSKIKYFSKAIYVGDSAEDYLMVIKANKIKHSFLFAGVYSLSSPKQSKQMFIEAKADIIMSTVNDLPAIFDFLLGE